MFNSLLHNIVFLFAFFGFFVGANKVGFSQTMASWNYLTQTGNLGTTYSWIDCSAGIDIITGDDEVANIDWPFNFSLYDNSYTPANQLSVSTNGFIRLDGVASGSWSDASSYDLAATATSLGQIIALAVYDGNVSNIYGSWTRYVVTGVAPNRVLTVEFNHYEIDWNDPYFTDVQVSFYETSNKFVVKLGVDDIDKDGVDMGVHSGVDGYFHKWGELKTLTNNTWIEYSPIPNLIATPASLDFGYVANGETSSVDSYILSGSNLTGGNVDILPPSNVEVSLSATGPWTSFGSTLNIPYSGSTLLDEIYVQFKPTSTNTNYIKDVGNSGGGASNKNMVVRGTTVLNYCDPDIQITSRRTITNVGFNAIDNSSGYPSSGVYSDFTYLSTDVIQNSQTELSVDIEITNNSSGYVNAWIDWNHNGDFADVGEYYFLGNESRSGTYTKTLNIIIPSSSTSGETRFRVAIYSTSDTDPCGDGNARGEVEDYTINIVGACSVIAQNVTGGGAYCSGTGGVEVGLDDSETGVTYTLYWNGTSTGTSVAGSGSEITFGNQTVAGTYTVLGHNDTEDCDVDMSGSAIVSVNPSPTLTTVNQSADVCDGSPATINLKGLVANSTFSLAYSVNGNPQTPITGMIADGSGNSSFTTSNLIVLDDGKTLEITDITITSSTPNCSHSFSGISTGLSVLPTDVGVSISASPSGSVCPGTTVTYTATPTNGGTAPSYQWKVNGTNVGTDSNIFSYEPADGDEISCVLTSNSPCAKSSASVPILFFSWDDDTKQIIDSDFGLDAVSVDQGAQYSSGALAPGSANSGSQGIDLTFSGAEPELNFEGLEYSVDYRRGEGQAEMFTRGAYLVITSGSNFSISYRIGDGAGSFTTVSSGNVYAIPSDDTFHNYTFLYNPQDGIGRLIVDSDEKWQSSPTPGQPLYWEGASGDNLLVGKFVDASGTQVPTFDNLSIKAINEKTASDSITTVVNPLIEPTLSSNSPICVGDDAVFTITGTPGNVVSYTGAVGIPASPVTIGAGGVTDVTIPGVTSDVTLNLTNVSEGTCDLALNVNLSITVNPLPIAPTANNVTASYNGVVQMASATVGAGETIDWYTAATGGTSTTAPSGTNVGTYTAWAEARNTTTGCLSASRTEVTLTINERTLTITADDLGKNCGDADPALTYQITSGSLAGGDSFSGSLTRQAGEAIGTYNTLQGTLALNSNYDLTFVPGIFTISDTESPVANCVSTLTVNLDANGEAAITPEMLDNGSTDNCGIDTMWVSPEVLGCSGSVGGSAEKNYSATIATSDGADVTITLSNFEVVPHSTICTNGYNYDIKFDYEIDYSGSNSFTLWTKQLNITINGDAFDIQTGVTGTVSSVTTTNNQYRSESDCNTVSFSDLVVNSITWYVAANYIPEQTITLQEESSSPSSQNVTLTVVDNRGNTNTCTTAVILNDAIAPAPDVAILPNITAECSVTSLTAPTATDNCVGSITGTHNATLPITTQGTTVVIWTYDDGNGNISTQTQNVVIDDVSDPTFTCPTATTVAFDASCQVTIPDLISGITDENDNCGTPTLSQLPVAGTVLASGAGMTHTVTITADDGNGNTKTCDVSVTGEPTDPIGISIVALADFCQSGQNGTTTITWTVTLLAGTPDWSYDYTIKDGSSELASDTNVSATGDITISYTMNNQANDKTFTLTITNVKDDCGISETGTTVHIEDVTVQAVPATGEIIPD